MQVSNVNWLKNNLVSQLCGLAANAYSAAKKVNDSINQNSEVNALLVVELRRNHIRMSKFIKYVRTNYGAALNDIATDQFSIYKDSISDVSTVAQDLAAQLAAFAVCIAEVESLTTGRTLQNETDGTDDNDPGNEYYVWSSTGTPSFGELNVQGVNELQAACQSVFDVIADPSVSPLPSVS